MEVIETEVIMEGTTIEVTEVEVVGNSAHILAVVIGIDMIEGITVKIEIGVTIDQVSYNYQQ